MPREITQVLASQNLLDEHGRIPASFKSVLKKQSGSAAGWSAVSSWLTCPERSRLTSLGVQRRSYDEFENDELSDLSFGSLAHYLRALRVAYGPDAVEAALAQWRDELPPKSFALARMLFRTYESLYPRAGDTFEYLGVEAEVVSNIAPEGSPSILRTVRYDTVIRLKGVAGAPDEVFSFEAKTSARGGVSAMSPYTGQTMCQVAIWNANPAMVAQYGRMRGVIYDVLLKTTNPNIDRIGPNYYGRVHEKLAREYLALPDNGGVTFHKLPDGTYPKMLHACWGRWRACEFIPLCHEGSVGEYQFKDGRPYGG